MKRANRILIVMLTGATFLTALLGNMGINWVKLAGIGLAVLTFLPVFWMIKIQMATGSPEKFMAVFVMGFLFKMTVLLVMIWIAIARLNWDTVDFVTASLVFLIVFQGYESLYFMEFQKNNYQEHT